MEAAERGMNRLRQAVQSEGKGKKAGEQLNVQPYRQRFIEAMDDDFNTPKAVATLFDLAKEINRADDAGEARSFLVYLGKTLGLTFQEREEAPLDAGVMAQDSAIIYQALGLPTPLVATDTARDIIQNLIDLRQELRKAGKWGEADMVRDKLADSGIALADTSTRTVWKRKR